MQINWKVRFQNKTFLAGLISLVVVFIYDLLQLLEITPAVTQSAVMQVAEGVLTILGMVGVGPVMAPIITKLGPVVDKWAGTVREPEPAK